MDNTPPRSQANLAALADPEDHATSSPISISHPEHRRESLRSWVSRRTSDLQLHLNRATSSYAILFPDASSPPSSMLRSTGPGLLNRLHSSFISNPMLEFQAGAAISAAVADVAAEQSPAIPQAQLFGGRRASSLVNFEGVCCKCRKQIRGVAEGLGSRSASVAGRGVEEVVIQESEIAPLEITPLPKKLMFVLCVVIFSEPMSMTILFPFVYFMVRDFGIEDEKQIGYYVGWIASAFSLAQFCTSMFWGWASDRIGRRVILLCGLIGNSVTILSFGVSNSLNWAILSRLACGFLNGNIGVAKSVLGEITDQTNTAKAFSVFGLMWGIGMIMGPVLGGFLSNPTVTMPKIFGGCPFLRQNPYFLPCFISAIISIIGFTVGYFYLDETLPRIVAARTATEASQRLAQSPRDATETNESSRPVLTHTPGASTTSISDDYQPVILRNTRASSRQSISSIRSVSSLCACCCEKISPLPQLSGIDETLENQGGVRDSTETLDGESTTSKILKSAAVDEDTDDDLSETTPLLKGQNKQSRRGASCCCGLGYESATAVLVYGFLSFQNIIFDEVMPLWAVTPPKYGGLGYSATDIGMTLSIMGVVTLFVQLVVFPQTSRRFDPLAIYRSAMPVYVLVFLGFPLISTFISPVPSRSRWTFPIMICNMALRHTLNVHCFTSVMLLINNSATDGQFGFVNGIGQSAAAFVRSIGPALGGIVWSWSLTNGSGFPLNYCFVFILLMSLSCLSALQSRMMPDSLRRLQSNDKGKGSDHGQLHLEV